MVLRGQIKCALMGLNWKGHNPHYNYNLLKFIINSYLLPCWAVQWLLIQLWNNSEQVFQIHGRNKEWYLNLQMLNALIAHLFPLLFRRGCLMADI